MSKHIVLEGRIKTLQALSHIGSSSGPDAFFNKTTVLNERLEPEEVCLYTGNGFRGMLRDLAAEYLMDKLGIAALDEETFSMFWEGGSIGGPQSMDIDKARRYRSLVPMYSLFGGGVGNQMIEGKMCMGSMYPICRECSNILPRRFRADHVSWREMMVDRSYTRKDDSKNERLREKYLQHTATLALPEGKEKGERKPPQQMRYSIQTLCEGAQLYQRIDFAWVEDVDLGVFVSAMRAFRRHPYLGGNKGKGHGLCEITYEWRDADSGSDANQHFLTVGSDLCDFSPAATRALEAYDDYLMRVYMTYLESNKTTLKQLLSGGAGDVA